MKKLTDQLREELRVPFGEIMSTAEVLDKARNRKGLLVSVGDECGEVFLKAGVKPDVIIYDFKIKRADVGDETRAILEGMEGKLSCVPNEASTINPLMEAAVKRALKGKVRKIFVDGEEDLAALVALMHAEDGALITYGQPDKGIVVVESNEKMRNKARAIYRKMIDV